MSEDMFQPVLEPRVPVTSAQIYEALSASNGNISASARAVGLTRTNFVARVQKSPALMALLEDLRETIVDKAEQNQYAEVLAGDAAASRFILQTLGKNRGYSTGVAGTGKDGAIVVEIKSFTERELVDGQV